MESKKNSVCLKSLTRLQKHKTLLQMRFILAILLAVLFNIKAMAVYSQVGSVSLNLKQVTIEKALNAIEKQTGYYFVYNNKSVNVDRVINLNASNKAIGDVLAEVFKGSVKYSIEGNHIILSPAEHSTQQQGNHKVKGVITDVKGEPIVGATVREKGSPTNGTITNVDGEFNMEVSSGSVLTISYIGYASQEVKVSGKNAIKVTLAEDTKLLDEVVVVGYGSQKKANLTGSVSSVKMDDVVGNRPIISASDALQGTVPGLFVGSGGNAPGASKSFRIRGSYSIGSGSTISPLVLIDNVEGDIDMINPEDIETVTVLKDAASSAIYGARAAGGVILITTKRPQNKTDFTLNYNNNFAFGNAVNLPQQSTLDDYLSAYYEVYGDQFWTMGSPSVTKWREYLAQYRKDPSSINTVGDGMFKDTDGAVYFLHEKDLIKDMLTNSFQMTHNVSASGGTDKLRYRLSGSAVSSNGVLITDKDKFNRMTFNAFISADVTPWFTQEATVSYAHSKKNLPSSALGSVYGTRLVSYYPEGLFPTSISGASTELPGETPRSQLLNCNTSSTLVDNPRIFLKSIIKPFKGFEGVFEYTFDRNENDYNYYTGKYTYANIQAGVVTVPATDYLYKNKEYTNYNAFNVYGTYRFDLMSNHHFKLMAGFNQESHYYEGMDAYSYAQAVTEVPAMASGTSTIKVADNYNDYTVRGGFFRVNYNYLDRYLLEVNGRYDGSSKFPKSNRFGFFPSISAGWQLAEESFMKPTRTWLDQLKLRGSYGSIGNQNIASYSYTPTMSINNKYSGWLSGGNYVTAVTSIPSLVRSNFTWEKVYTLDFGMDFALFNNRLNGTFDWYQRDTKGMLAPGVELPSVVGASAPYQNTADMRTKGWELAVNWNGKINKLGYRIGINITDYTSKITKYDANDSKLLSSYYEGQKLGEIWGYVTDGYYTVDDFESTSTWKLKDGVTALNGYNPRPGDVKFKNLMDDDQGTNLITSGNNTKDNPGDRKIIGNSQPRWLYGISLGANYAGFDLNIYLQGVGKRDNWIANNIMFPLYNDPKFIGLYKGTEDYWRPTDAANGDYTAQNPNAKYPRIYGSYGNSGSNYRVSDRYLSNTSYLRIKNVSLSYTVPKVWLKTISLQSAKAFVSIENLATFTSLRKGIDPETLSWNYPLYRTISFGCNLTF